jgi:hypothetical protein
MQTLKDYIIEALALITVSYKNLGARFLLVDASKEGASACLEQTSPNSKRYPCRFKSTL